MEPLHLFILAWTLSGGLAWRVATLRNASRPQWAVIGQVLGPFAIPLALMVKRKG